MVWHCYEFCSAFYLLNHAMSVREKNMICKFLKNLLSIKRSGLEDKASNSEALVAELKVHLIKRPYHNS